jgi:3-deoxy-D-manno-octulosonic-acid transferase
LRRVSAFGGFTSLSVAKRTGARTVMHPPIAPFCGETGNQASEVPGLRLSCPGMMRFVVDFVYLTAALAISPLVALRSWRTGKYRRDWDQRRGFVPDLAVEGSPNDRRVWFHAVSVGEVNAVKGLVELWRSRHPGWEVVISSTTDTGIDRARTLFPDDVVIRWPLDFSRWVGRALDRIRPDLVVLVELEVWYQFTAEAARRGIPVAVVNGRITAGKSVKWFRLLGPLVRPMFRRLAWVGAQDEEYAERFRLVGVPADRVAVTGSMKWDAAPKSDIIPGTQELAEAMGWSADRRTWVCGSTAPGEERVILEACRRLLVDHPGLQLVIVPRKPERFDEVAALIESEGFVPVRRSERPDGAKSNPVDKGILLVDTMGELRKAYTLADVVFVGRTLADMGGSDMMEVAALGKPMILGPHTENFADPVRHLVRAEAVSLMAENLQHPEIATRLAAAVHELLVNSTQAGEMVKRGREVVRVNQGATQRTLDALTEIVNRAKHGAS